MPRDYALNSLRLNFRSSPFGLQHHQQQKRHPRRRRKPAPYESSSWLTSALARLRQRKMLLRPRWAAHMEGTCWRRLPPNNLANCLGTRPPSNLLMGLFSGPHSELPDSDPAAEATPTPVTAEAASVSDRQEVARIVICLKQKHDSPAKQRRGTEHEQ